MQTKTPNTTLARRQIIEKALYEENNPEQLFQLGKRCLKEKLLPEAHLLFKRTFKMHPHEPLYRSYLGLTMGLAENQMDLALQLCETALERNYFHPDLYCNLGRIYIMTDAREKAYSMFRKGLIVDDGNKDLISEMKKMGLRKKPVFPFLKRQNLLNRIAGQVRCTLTSAKTPPTQQILNARNSNEKKCYAFAGRPITVKQ